MTDAAPTDAPRAARNRLIGILVLAAVVAAAAIASVRAGRAPDTPERVFNYVRDRVLAGDGDAMWREMTPRARQDYAKFLQILDKPGGGQGTVFDPADWRKRVGLSAEDVRRLPPEKVLAKEMLALADELFRGARVYSVKMLDDDLAYLQITLRSGHDRFWLTRRMDDSWKIDDLWAMLGPDGTLVPRPGEVPRGPSGVGGGRGDGAAVTERSKR